MRITIQNRTGRPLVPYLMVETKAGQRRLAQAALTVPAGGSYELDPRGGNPVFFDPRDAGQPTRPGVLVELPLVNEPKVLASTVFDYTLPPDQADFDPAHAPRPGRRTERRLAPSTTSVTISLNSDFEVGFNERGGTLAAPA